MTELQKNSVFCLRCGNINWARRTTCNLCNAPKVGPDEQRTGIFCIYYLLVHKCILYLRITKRLHKININKVPKKGALEDLLLNYTLLFSHLISEIYFNNRCLPKYSPIFLYMPISIYLFVCLSVCLSV